MGQKYHHLTIDERIYLFFLFQAGFRITEISKRLKRSHSTISREIKRNSSDAGYHFYDAQFKSYLRSSIPRTFKLTHKIQEHLRKYIQQEYSPEQISATMEKKLGSKVSHETIYKWIYKEAERGGNFHSHLRINNRKRRGKRHKKKCFRGSIPNRVDISKRPKVVENKTRIGDWEADLMVGKNHKGFLVTLTDRKTKYTLIGKVKYKEASLVEKEISRLLKDRCVHTITYDNGREFSNHEEVNLALGSKSYFARPYHSWERGLNENTNGLIRQYFPKEMDLREVSKESLDFVMSRLNNRPRKTLDWKTPADKFERTG